MLHNTALVVLGAVAQLCVELRAFVVVVMAISQPFPTPGGVVTLARPWHDPNVVLRGQLTLTELADELISSPKNRVAVTLVCDPFPSALIPSAGALVSKQLNATFTAVLDGVPEGTIFN